MPEDVWRVYSYSIVYSLVFKGLFSRRGGGRSCLKEERNRGGRERGNYLGM